MILAAGKMSERSGSSSDCILHLKLLLPAAHPLSLLLTGSESPSFAGSRSSFTPADFLTAPGEFFKHVVWCVTWTAARSCMKL